MQQGRRVRAGGIGRTSHPGDGRLRRGERIGQETGNGCLKLRRGLMPDWSRRHQLVTVAGHPVRMRVAVQERLHRHAVVVCRSVVRCFVIMQDGVRGKPRQPRSHPGREEEKSQQEARGARPHAR